MVEARAAVHDDQRRPLDHPLAVDRELRPDDVEEDPGVSDVDVHAQPVAAIAKEARHAPEVRATTK